jgi:hypothetical protein
MVRGGGVCLPWDPHPISSSYPLPTPFMLSPSAPMPLPGPICGPGSAQWGARLVVEDDAKTIVSSCRLSGV